MPDTRDWRGPHPKDHECFTGRWLPVLRGATYELSWLLERGYSDDQWKKMAELGFLGVPWPEEYGGAGLDYLSYIMTVHELCRLVQTVLAVPLPG